MKCISCGAIVASDQKKCPYCGAKNPEYERKNAIFGFLNSQYIDAKDKTQNIIANFLLAAVVLLLVSIVSAMVLGYGLVRTADGIRFIRTGNSHVAKMEEYYTTGEYEKLYSYMEQNNLFEKEKYYKYSQAAHIVQAMNDLRVGVYPFIEYANGERSDTKYTYNVENILSRAHIVEDWRFLEGEKVYLEQIPLCKENEPLYDECMTEMRYIFTGYFGLTNEEFDDCFLKGGYYSNSYAELIKERTDFFNEE